MNEPLLPESLQRGVNRLVKHVSSVDVAAAGILGLQSLIIWWVSAFGGPYRDDFRLQSMAVEQPLTEWALRSPGSHFAPFPGSSSRRRPTPPHGTWG